MNNSENLVSARQGNTRRDPDLVNFSGEKVSYAIALRNGIVAITHQPNKGPGLKLTKGDWSKLILGEITFASLNSRLKAFDQALGR